MIYGFGCPGCGGTCNQRERGLGCAGCSQQCAGAGFGCATCPKPGALRGVGDVGPTVEFSDPINWSGLALTAAGFYLVLKAFEHHQRRQFVNRVLGDDAPRRRRRRRSK